MDPRHERRLKLVQSLYAYLFQPAEGTFIPPDKNLQSEIDAINSKKSEIDHFISLYAPKYPLDTISKIDLCILRLAIYELKFNKTEPEKVIINEAVELAKELGNERSYAFINAVLGSVLKDTNIESETHE